MKITVVSSDMTIQNIFLIYPVPHIINMRQGKTLEEARENLYEAIELILRANRELAEEELSGKEFIREEIKVAI